VSEISFIFVNFLVLKIKVLSKKVVKNPVKTKKFIVFSIMTKVNVIKTMGFCPQNYKNLMLDSEKVL